MFIKSWPSRDPTGLSYTDYFPRPEYNRKLDYADKIANSLPFNYFCRNILNMRKTNNNNNDDDDKGNRMNIATFHDWSEESLKQWPPSTLHQEVATLTSICSLSDPNRQAATENWNNRPAAYNKRFQPEGTDFTKGEKHIIAGLCRNSGCILPHIDNQTGQGYHGLVKKRESFKGRKLVSCISPLLSQTQSGQMPGNRDSVINRWWERHSESAPPFPMRVKYSKDYKSGSLFDVGRSAYFGEHGSSALSSASTRGTAVPPNTPDKTSGNKNGSNNEEFRNSKMKQTKSSRKEVKVENGKKKTHLIVYLPKTEQEEEDEVVVTERDEGETATGNPVIKKD